MAIFSASRSDVSVPGHPLVSRSFNCRGGESLVLRTKHFSCYCGSRIRCSAFHRRPGCSPMQMQAQAALLAAVAGETSASARAAVTNAAVAVAASVGEWPELSAVSIRRIDHLCDELSPIPITGHLATFCICVGGPDPLRLGGRAALRGRCGITAPLSGSRAILAHRPARCPGGRTAAYSRRER